MTLSDKETFFPYELYATSLAIVTAMMCSKKSGNCGLDEIDYHRSHKGTFTWEEKKLILKEWNKNLKNNMKKHVA